jgi:hypothetical protein
MMKKNYKSELYQVIHEEAVANFKVGAIGKDEFPAISQSAVSSAPMPALASQY